MNVIPTNQEPKPYFSNNNLQEFGQERVEMSKSFPVENTSIGRSSQPLQEQITFINVQPISDDHDMGLMSDKSSSSMWNILPPLVDTSGSNNTSSQRRSFFI
ncbi:hypothetical protein Tco_0256110 [Tanacetum coccineum]